MTRTPNRDISGEGRNSLPGQAAAALRFTASLPLRIVERLALHAAQILFALFVLILHPQLKWLVRIIAQSGFVRNYLKPSLGVFAAHIYNPYFAFLAALPPYWATFSIALPLAVVEPAKLFATILVAERPKTGVILWLALQGLSLILIDRTWAAVRPQSRKIRLVARLHAWVWLNAEYGKYWIRKSPLYRAAVQWKRKARRTARTLWLRFVRRRREGY